MREAPAAFRRLCVETADYNKSPGNAHAPAAFRRLCVETEQRILSLQVQQSQPPLGGCVLKQPVSSIPELRQDPAAFRRLCVETITKCNGKDLQQPAAFRRLCVETCYMPENWLFICQPAAFRRLCVETSPDHLFHAQNAQPPLGGCVLKLAGLLRVLMSYLPAAFRRLCVETMGHQ